MTKTSLPIWRLGFRPFFTLGTLYGVFVVLFWVLIQSGFLSWTFSLPMIFWHAHEMIFGFTSAIIAGFILTASQNWTGVPGVKGSKLKFLVLLWVAARVLSYFPSLAYLFTLVDLMFYPALAFLLIPYLGKPQQKRNHIFFLFFALMFLSNALLLYSQWEISNWSRQGYYLALHVVVAVIALIGGRVLPFFTQRALPNAVVHQNKWVERFSLASVLLFALVHFLAPSHFLFFLVSIIAFIVHTVRWSLWRPLQSLSKPILAILYIGYLWLPIGFLCYALSFYNYIPINISSHAFSAGAIGIMIFGMVHRVSLGHTGRALKASAFIQVGYLLITLAAVFRVILTGLFSSHSHLFMKLSGTMWFLAFLILSIHIVPMLLKPRPDSKPG